MKAFKVGLRAGKKEVLLFLLDLTSRNLLTADQHREAAVVEDTQAPPATVLIQRLQDQMPTQLCSMESSLQKEHVFLACWVTSIFPPFYGGIDVCHIFQ
ncbi:jg5922 [Pararge aegeria aegeria]|uniref:Jg5922 protein n=1 Tax=Pararge aegeria aegeria TaxID=348720 RepID=A0A8S4REL3_9NEOP|nr:jg5922 [Pararge aegeria aegeria]